MSGLGGNYNVIYSTKEGTRGAISVGAHQGGCLKDKPREESDSKKGGARELTPGSLTSSTPDGSSVRN